MRVKMNIDLLSKYLKNTAYIVTQFKDESGFAHIGLQTVDKDQLVVTLSSDSDKAVITIPCEVIEHGTCSVTASKFIGITQGLIGVVELAKVNQVLSIKQNLITINLPLIRGDLLDTSFANAKFENEFTVEGDVLNKITNTVSPFVEKVEKGILQGVNLLIGNRQLKARACHNAAMAVSTYMCNDCDFEPISITMRIEALRAISKIFANEVVSIACSAGAVRVVGVSCTFYARLICGTYPSIERIIEDAHVTSLSVDRLAIENCLKHILAIKTQAKKVILDINEDQAAISYETLLFESFKVQQEGRCLKVAVNYEYLLDILRVFNKAELHISITPTFKLKFVDRNDIIIVCPLCL